MATELNQEDSLLVGVTIKGEEVKKFFKFKEEGRHRTNDAAAYALMRPSRHVLRARPHPLGRADRQYQSVDRELLIRPDGERHARGALRGVQV